MFLSLGWCSVLLLIGGLLFGDVNGVVVTLMAALIVAAGTWLALLRKRPPARSVRRSRVFVALSALVVAGLGVALIAGAGFGEVPLVVTTGTALAAALLCAGLACHPQRPRGEEVRWWVTFALTSAGAAVVMGDGTPVVMGYLFGLMTRVLGRYLPMK